MKPNVAIPQGETLKGELWSCSRAYAIFRSLDLPPKHSCGSVCTNVAPASPHYAEPSTGGPARPGAPGQAVLAVLVLVYHPPSRLGHGLPVTELLPKVE